MREMLTQLCALTPRAHPVLTSEMFLHERRGWLLGGSEGRQEALQALVGQGSFAIVQREDSGVGDGGTCLIPVLDPLVPRGMGPGTHLSVS